MEFTSVMVSAVCLLVLFAATTRARSLSGEASAIDPRESDAFKAFEAQFLKKLGLTEKPQGGGNRIVPQYMMHLYNSRVRDPEYISTNMVFKDFATTANTVRSFHHEDVPHKAGSVNRSKRHVYLDIGSVPDHEELVKAEFRVYNNRSSADPAHDQHRINVYQIVAPGVRKLLDSRVVNVSTNGWQSYDVLQAVKHWHKTPGENHGLEVDIMSENGHPIDISHLHFDKPRELDEQEWPHKRPLLALYSHDPNTHIHKKRVRRGSSHHRGYKGLCKRMDLVVDFNAQLKWDWVLQPTRYNAYMCQGKCEYPIPNHLNTTNHAIVQTLVHEVRKYRHKVPPACCVPTELESTMLLLSRLDGKDSKKQSFEIKDYPDMRVIGCGCR